MRDDTEIELKLGFDRAQLPRVRAVLRRLAGAGPRDRMLTATYYDTPTDRLLKSGHSLRIRVEDDRFVQTVKSATVGDAFTRDEWSDEVSDNRPRLSRGKSGRRIRRIIGDHPLHPRFSTRIKRQQHQIRGIGRAKIEAAIDIGVIKAAPNRVATVAEIELELKAGEPIALYRKALQVALVLPVRFESRTKSERGYQLTGQLPTVARFEPPALTRKSTVGEGLRAAARRYFAQYLANLPLMTVGEPGAVHMMRVAVRRLRSVVSAAKLFLPPSEASMANARLKSIQQSLGTLRDLDVMSVHLSATRPTRRRTAGKPMPLSWIERRRNRALSQATSAASSRARTIAWLQVMIWFESMAEVPRRKSSLGSPLHDAVPAMLDRLFKRARKRGRNLQSQSIDELHELRIACKKLRYGLELFGQLYRGNAVEQMLAPLKKLQDDLGIINDAYVARRAIGVAGQRRKTDQRTKNRIKKLEQRAAGHVVSAAKHIDGLRRAAKFW